MRKNVFLMAVLSLFIFQSCDKDDNGQQPDFVTTETKAAFSEKYPSVKKVSWKSSNGYFVADFKQGQTDIEAWFDKAGIWFMTETDIPFNQLPNEVKTAFGQSEYSGWKVDDVDMLERQGMETIYVIEVEQGENEMDLYYSPDGVLIKAIPDMDDDKGYEDFIPSQLSADISEYISKSYPSARILDVDVEKGMVEVEILDGKTCRELLFDNVGNWIQTETELPVSALPSEVLAAIRASQYATYQIDDVDFIQTPDGEWYLIELEFGETEVELRIDKSGIIL